LGTLSLGAPGYPHAAQVHPQVLEAAGALRQPQQQQQQQRRNFRKWIPPCRRPL